jgi:hypothetical protein
LTEPAERLEGDLGSGGEGGRGTADLIEHPGRDLQGASVLEIQPASKDGYVVPDQLGKNVSVPTEPGMERVADPTDIDQRGLVLRSSTTASGGIRP